MAAWRVVLPKCCLRLAHLQHGSVHEEGIEEGGCWRGKAAGHHHGFAPLHSCFILHSEVILKAEG